MAEPRAVGQRFTKGRALGGRTGIHPAGRNRSVIGQRDGVGPLALMGLTRLPLSGPLYLPGGWIRVRVGSEFGSGLLDSVVGIREGGGA